MVRECSSRSAVSGWVGGTVEGSPNAPAHVHAILRHRSRSFVWNVVLSTTASESSASAFDEGRRGAKKNQLFYVFQKASGIRLWDLTKKRGKRGERKECAGFCSEFYIDLDEMQFCSGAKVHIKLDLRGVSGRWKVRIGCVGWKIYGEPIFPRCQKRASYKGTHTYAHTHTHMHGNVSDPSARCVGGCGKLCVCAWTCCLSGGRTKQCNIAKLDLFFNFINYRYCVRAENKLRWCYVVISV